MFPEFETIFKYYLEIQSSTVLIECKHIITLLHTQLLHTFTHILTLKQQENEDEIEYKKKKQNNNNRNKSTHFLRKLYS